MSRITSISLVACHFCDLYAYRAEAKLFDVFVQTRPPLPQRSSKSVVRHWYLPALSIATVVQPLQRYPRVQEAVKGFAREVPWLRSCEGKTCWTVVDSGVLGLVVDSTSG